MVRRWSKANTGAPGRVQTCDLWLRGRRPIQLTTGAYEWLVEADGVVSLNFASWNQLDGWLRQIEGLRRVA